MIKTSILRLSSLLILFSLLKSFDAIAQNNNIKLLLPFAPGWNVINEGETLTFPLEVMGQEDDTYIYSISNGWLEGMELDSAGNFTWVPDFDLVDRLEEHRTFPIVFEVENSKKEKDSKQVEITVLHTNRPPEIKELKPFYIKYGAKNVYTVDPHAVRDPDHDPWVFRPILSQMPEGLTLSENGRFEWKPSLSQYRRLRAEPLLLSFFVEDQPGKAQVRGTLLIKATHLDLPPEISMMPDFQEIKIKENETINLKFFLSDPNGDENIDKFNFLSEDRRVDTSSLIQNTITQYEFIWTPDYDFVLGGKDSITFDLTFYVIDKTNLRENKTITVTVYETENLIEKERQLYSAYRGALSRAASLLAQLDEKEKELKKSVKKARSGKRNRAIIDASLGAATGLSPVFLENQPQKYVSGLGGTTVMTLGTLEATEVIGRSSKELTEKLNFVLEKKNELQMKGDIFARKYAFNSSRQSQDFEKELSGYLQTMNLKNLASLELDAGWENKNQQQSDRHIKKYFNDFNTHND